MGALLPILAAMIPGAEADRRLYAARPCWPTAPSYAPSNPISPERGHKRMASCAPVTQLLAWVWAPLVLYALALGAGPGSSWTGCWARTCHAP